MKTFQFIILFLTSAITFSWGQVNDTIEEFQPFLPVTSIEEMPEFPGGQIKLYQYIAANIKYPEEARKNNITGKVTAQFVVTAEGKITKIRLVQKLGYGCDEEAIRVLSGMPDWKPGLHNGKAIPVTFYLPVSFKP